MLLRPRRARIRQIAAAALLWTNAVTVESMNAPKPRQRRHRKLETRPSIEVIQDAYIVILNDHVMDSPEQIAQEFGISTQHLYHYGVKGFSSSYVEASILERLLEDPRVQAIGQDGTLESEQDDEDGGSWRAAQAVNVQLDAPDHLDSIDQMSGNGVYAYTYTGAGVHVYIVDAGIRATHQDFGGRVSSDCFSDIGTCNVDNESHGTHIASLAGGSTYGVAKQVTIHDTRIYDNMGIVSWSNLIGGLDYVAGEQLKSTGTIVVNVSMGGGGYDVVDNAIQKTLDTGAIVVVAAGNQAVDACDRTPSRVPGVITVGATGTSPDVRRSTSNYGPCIDIWAPGTNLLAASFQGDTNVEVKSGTSMASPLVVGAIALYLEAGKTVQDLLNDAEQIASLVGTDQSTSKFLSTTKLSSHSGPSSEASLTPTPAPILPPVSFFTLSPSPGPSLVPVSPPTQSPSTAPSLSPIPASTIPPSLAPTPAPTSSPSLKPTVRRSASPTLHPSTAPTLTPTATVTAEVTPKRSLSPTLTPSMLEPTTPPSPAPIPTLAPLPAVLTPLTLAPTSLVEPKPTTLVPPTIPLTLAPNVAATPISDADSPLPATPAPGSFIFVIPHHDPPRDLHAPKTLFVTSAAAATTNNATNGAVWILCCTILLSLWVQ